MWKERSSYTETRKKLLPAIIVSCYIMLVYCCTQFLCVIDIYQFIVCHWHLPIHCVSLTLTGSLCVIDIYWFIACHWHLPIHCVSLTFTSSLCVLDIYWFNVCHWHLPVHCVSLTFTVSMCVIDIYWSLCVIVCHWHLLVHSCVIDIYRFIVCHWHLSVHEFVIVRAFLRNVSRLLIQYNRVLYKQTPLLRCYCMLLNIYF